MVGRGSSAHRRSLLHKNRLEAFKKWVLDSKGYFLMEPTKHPYEVLRIRKYDPAGDGPDIFFYKKDRTDHITLCQDGEKLVKRFLKECPRARKAR